MTPTVAPQTPALPDLSALPPHLAAKFRNMNSAQLTDIFTTTELEGNTK